MQTNNEETQKDLWKFSGLLATPFRLVLAWIFFSAFWRRVVLAPAKLDPDSAAYVGHKFNTFLPQALGIRPMLEYLIVHENLLYTFLIVFTIIEGLVGLALFLGLGTRLAALGTALLSGGILLGAGWLGSTCLDEWQIGVLGFAGGSFVAFTGAGPFSLDSWWQNKWPRIAEKRYMRWLTTGPLPISRNAIGKSITILSIFAVLLTLYTNQAFHGGVYGKLHNPSKKPNITLSQPALAANGDLKINLYRDKGPDTYGAFIVAINVKDKSGTIVEEFDKNSLSAISPNAIDNTYLNKVVTGPYGLIATLGSKASVSIDSNLSSSLSAGEYTIEVIDVSGSTWSTPVVVK